MSEKTKGRINIETSMKIANQGFKYLGSEDLGEFGAGICCEGHLIRYAHTLKTEDGEEYIFGSLCIYKPYVLKTWMDLVPISDLQDSQLIRAGKWLWIIERDGLPVNREDIPSPKDFDGDYKALADALKNLALKARKKLKDEKKEEERKLKRIRYEIERKQAYENFGGMYPEQDSLIKKLVLKYSTEGEGMNNWEREFVASVVGQHRTLKVLSERQVAVIERILNSNFEVSEFVGKQIREWIIKKHTGRYTKGKIISVNRETQKAVLAKVIVNNGEIIEYEEWFPKSSVIQ